MIARALRSPSVYLPGIALATLAIAMWSSGWFWVLLLVAAFAVAPWFAAARLLDDKAELTTRVERLTTALSAALAEHANCPAPVIDIAPAGFAERMVDAARGRLRIVQSPIPEQRTGHEPWPPIARAVAAETPIHDGLVVEEFMEAVEAWGNDVDGAS